MYAELVTRRTKLQQWRCVGTAGAQAARRSLSLSTHTPAPPHYLHTSSLTCFSCCIFLPAEPGRVMWRSRSAHPPWSPDAYPAAWCLLALPAGWLCHVPQETEEGAAGVLLLFCHQKWVLGSEGSSWKPLIKAKATWGFEHSSDIAAAASMEQSVLEGVMLCYPYYSSCKRKLGTSL